MRRIFRTIICTGICTGAVLSVVGACAGPPRGGLGIAAEREIELRVLAGYDADGDGTLTRAELDSGLARAFRQADGDGNARLNRDEMAAENQRRWAVEGPSASPLIDWNSDGGIDATEFATTARNLFVRLDENEDGVLDVVELSLPRSPFQRPQDGALEPGIGPGPGGPGQHRHPV